MEELLQIIDARIKMNVPNIITVGRAVNVRDQYCDVERDGEPKLLNVRLHAVGLNGSEYIRIKPKKNSYVLVGLIDNNEAEAYLLAYSSVDTIELRGNNNGGLVISKKVADEINEIKQDLNALKTVFNTWVVAPSDGGAALKSAAATWSGNNLSPAIPSDLENKNVKHG